MTLTRLLFIGQPGAGKGTQAKLLDLPHISTGEVIREAFAKKNSLLLPYQESIEKGGFLPDELIFDLIGQHIQYFSNSKGYILDGAVRTIPQAEFVLQKGLIDAVFEFYCPEEEARRRLQLRGEKEHRKDDSLEAIDNRFKEYLNRTFSAIVYLAAQSHTKNFKYFVINANQSIEEVHKEVINRLFNIN